MTIEYAAYWDGNVLLTRGQFSSKLAKAAWIEPGNNDPPHDSQFANNIFHPHSVILMDSRFVTPVGGIHADLP
jgi:hypothetical protein